MALNIVELVSKQLDGEKIQHLSAWLGERPEAIQKALNAGIPSLIGGLTQSAKNNENAASLLSTLTAAAKEPDPRENFSDALGREDSPLLRKGQKMLNALLPDQLDGIIRKISQYSGMGQDSVNSLLKAIMPLIMSVIGRQQSDLGLDAGGLQKLFASQSQHIQAALPEQLSQYTAKAKSASFGKTLVWIVIIAAIGWILWQWLQQQ